MSWTKRDFITAAFEEIGYAAYAYDLDPQQLESALKRLDSMVSTWNGRGIRLGYPLPGSPGESDLDQISNVPDSANEAIYLNLALRIAPLVGKSAATETTSAARSAYRELLLQTAKPQEMQYPESLPVGSGNKPWRSTNDQYFPTPDNPVTVGDDGPLDFN